MAQNVTQDQPVIISQAGKVATLNCRYEISRNVHDYWIFWYKQLPSGEMTYVIHQYSEDRNESASSVSCTIASPPGDLRKKKSKSKKHLPTIIAS